LGTQKIGREFPPNAPPRGYGPTKDGKNKKMSLSSIFEIKQLLQLHLYIVIANKWVSVNSHRFVISHCLRQRRCLKTIRFFIPCDSSVLKLVVRHRQRCRQQSATMLYSLFH